MDILNNGRCTYSTDGRLLVIWGNSKRAPIWNREGGDFLRPPTHQSGKVFDLSMHQNVIAHADIGKDNEGMMHFLDPQSGEPLMASLPYSNWPMLTQLDATGERLPTGGGDTFAQVWDWRNHQPLDPSLTHGKIVLAGTFLPGRQRVVTGSYDDRLRFWDY